jgi:hypothetical protein
MSNNILLARRALYRCQRCGQPKRGHTCPLRPRAEGGEEKGHEIEREPLVEGAANIEQKSEERGRRGRHR